MNVTRRVAKNSAAQLLSTAIRVALGFAFTIYIGRTMGPDWLGKLAILLAFLNVFQILSAFGIPPLVTREVARSRTETSRYFYGALLAQGILGVLAALLMALAAWLLRYPSDTTQMLLVGTLSVPLFAVAAAVGGILQAYEKMEYGAIIEAVSSGLQWVALLAVPLADWGILALPAIKVGGMAVSTALHLYFLTRMRVVGPPVFDLSFAWRLTHRAFDLLVLALVGSILFRIDIFVLSKVLNEVAVGIYNAALQLVKMVALMAQSYGYAILPTLSRLHRDAPRFFLAAIRKSLQYGIMLLLPLAVGTALLSRQLIQLVYGPVDYNASIGVLQVLAWYMPLQFAYVVFEQTLIASDQQRQARQIGVIMLAASFFYQVTFSLLWGATGAAAANVLSYLTGVVLGQRYMARSVGWFRMRVVFGKPVLATLGMAAVLWPLRAQPLFVAVPVAVAVYGGLLVALRAFAPEDWALVRRILSGGQSASAALADAAPPADPQGANRGAP